MKRTLKYLGIVVGAATSILGAAYLYFLKRPQLPQKGNVKIDGLDKPVEIIRDKWGIPHIYAQNEPDLFLAQGYIHAQDRLWQMDFYRRLASGNLAEIFGENAIPVDNWFRVLGLRVVAEKEVKLLDKRTNQMMVSYCAGINRRIKEGRLPVEFSLLRYTPAPWVVTDIICWGKLMTWNLSGNWEAELLRSQLEELVGKEKAALFEPENLEIDIPIISTNLLNIKDKNLVSNWQNEVRKFVGPGPGEGIGSNNWVISGRRSATGKPFLANDMHLGMSSPSIWYENHLVGGSLNLSGITFPGFPGLVTGHNGHVAWGFTNGFPDVQDLYIEHLRKGQNGKIQYEFKGGWHDAETREEVINIRNKKPEKITVVITRHGPVLNQLGPIIGDGNYMALRWTAQEPGESANAFNEMIRARNCDEFKLALKRFDAPTQNTVYADIDGNIYYSFPGKIPIRSKGDGRTPVPGWTGEYEWLGFIPFDELPHLKNPDNGYIVSANNRVTADGNYPYWLGNDFLTSNRALRITELIDGQPIIDVEYIKRMQQDQVSIPARILMKKFMKITTGNPEINKVAELIAQWDGNLESQKVEAVIYEVLVPILLRKILAPALGNRVENYIGKGLIPYIGDTNIFGGKARNFLLWFLESQSDTGSLSNGKSHNELLISALQDTIEFLKQNFGPNPENWSWGKLHKITFRHPLGDIKTIGYFLNRGPYSIGGDFDTIWATGTSYTDFNDHHMTSAPFRFIADLSNFDHSLGCLVPGQSGLPFSPHYSDQIENWLAGRYHPMYYSRKAVEKNSKTTMWMVPS